MIQHNRSYQFIKTMMMKFLKTGLFALISMLFVCSCREMKPTRTTLKPDEMMVRIAEIEILPDSLQSYLSILKEESEASVRIEPGVISIFPMVEKDAPNEIRILEIYANKAAYELHLQTPHFKHYKTATIKMVKSLKLIEMKAVNGAAMPAVFAKLHLTSSGFEHEMSY